MGDKPTIEDVARTVLADVSPGELDYLPVSAELIFGDGQASQHAMQAALDARRRNGPTGFGADSVGAIVAFVLTILNGVATQVLAGQVTEGAGRLRARWRAWRQRRAIANSTAPAGLATPLPALTAIQAARVGREVQDLAVTAGVSAEQAQRISTLIAAALTEK
jgi:hypothetical protein